MTKEQTARVIQAKLAELAKGLDEIKALADVHQIEFSWMGMTMHYADYYDYAHPGKKALAKTGLLVADSEWQGSGMGCNGDPAFNNWRRANWPEDFDDEGDA